MKKQEIYNFWKKLEIDLWKINLILEKITGLTKEQLFLLEEIDDKFMQKIENYFSRVVSGEPLEYILENTNFYWLDFFVDSRVLVPRNDTEIMVEKVIEELENKENNILIDVWTGSGAIPISILKTILSHPNLPLRLREGVRAFAIDISKKALEITKINIKKHNLENKIKLINSDLLESTSLLNSLSLGGERGYNIIITANLPYIKDWDYENMDEETVYFEPDLALYWWEKTGFELYEKLISQVFEIQSINNIKKIILFIEIWFDQKEIARKFLENNNLKFEIFKDNWGIDRCVKIEF